MTAPRRVVTLLLACALSSLPLGAQQSPAAEEIPIEQCDRLPIVTAEVDGTRMRFLLDTGATTILNLKSFSRGRSKSIQVSSWSGTAVTTAREVTLPELALGRYRLRNLKLPAVDLSSIGKACGGQIDGILGVDLLEKMGATIDLARRVARLNPGSNHSHEAAEIAEHEAFSNVCVEAFNRRDAQFLTGCFDPEIVLFTPDGEFRSGKAAVEHLEKRYFRLDPPARIEFRHGEHHLLGDALWYTYEYTLELPSGKIVGRGTGICRKVNGRWRTLSMHNSPLQADAAKP